MTITEQPVYALAVELLGSKKTDELKKIINSVVDDEIKNKLLVALGKDLLAGANNETRTVKFQEFSSLTNQKRSPVSVDEFIRSPYYLDLDGQVYPEVLSELEKINSGEYVEAVLTGAIGTAKTTIALWTTAYQIYLLSCLHSPQKAYGLDRTSEILFVFQSLSIGKATKLNYGRFKELIHKSPYFNEKYPYNKNIESELIFPNRVIVRPIASTSTAAIGENVMGGIIDELNFMSVIENSKQSDDGTGVYNQALSNYNAIARRRKSRFISRGRLAGILCLVSSRKYPGQFTDMKEDEAKNDPTIYVYDKRVWDIKPKDTFCGEKFPVFTGTPIKMPYVIDDLDAVPAGDKPHIDWIPIEYKNEFTTDIVNAVRDIAGKSTLASHTFMTNTSAVLATFGHHPSLFSRPDVDFEETQLEIYPDRILHKNEERFCHIDLAMTRDSVGLVIGCVTGFEQIAHGSENPDDAEWFPRVHVDATLEVKPPRGGEVNFAKVRNVLYVCRQVGLPVKWVTFDSFQSADSRQLLAKKGFVTGLRSMDKDSTPYEYTKQMIYNGLITAPDHPKLAKELISLEQHPRTGKIDHTPAGSKDIADAFAGVVYGLLTRSELWLKHNIPIRSLPDFGAKGDSTP